MSLEPTQSLKIWEGNARKHSKKQVRKIAESIKSFGFTAPLLIDEDGAILAGHGRYAAAKLLGLDLVPCITLSHLTNEQKRAYVIADNRLSDESVWDYGILAQELSAIKISDPDLDLSLTGFSLPEIETVLKKRERKQEKKEEKANFLHEHIKAQTSRDDCLPLLTDQTRVERGDIWQIGHHRILCDDPSSHIAINRLMGGSKASFVITDPSLPQDICDLGQDEKVIAYYRALFQIFSNASHPSSVHLFFSHWSQWDNIKEAAKSIYCSDGMPADVIIWDKRQSDEGLLYRSGYGMVFAYLRGKTSQDTSQSLSRKFTLQRSNVWSYCEIAEPLTLHYESDAYEADRKPVTMLCHAIEDLSQGGDIILDGFGWTGTSLIAAQKTGRKAFICEEDPVLCEVILRRAEAFTHEAARLVSRAAVKNMGATP